jgi:hypothetical protein
VIHEAKIGDVLVRLLQVISSSKETLPDKNAEGLSICHVHEQRANHKPKALAVADFGIIKTEAS